MQQKNCIENYLSRLNKNINNIQSIVEKVSGTVKHTERKLKELLDMCKDGDTIYVSELSRLGRNMSDLFAIVTEASERGVTLVQCKDGSIIENNSIGGKALLFALSLAAEIEVQNIRQRTKMGLEARKKQLEEHGYFVNRKGEKITDWCCLPNKGTNFSANHNDSTATSAASSGVVYLTKVQISQQITTQMAEKIAAQGVLFT